MDTTALLAEIKKIPPVTRFLAGSSLAVTLPVMMHFVSIYKVVYHWSLVRPGKFELWRIWTTFFYGGSGIHFLFDFVMLFRTSSTLETDHYMGRSADYAWQLILVAASLLCLNHPLGTHFLQRPFLLSLIYLSSCLSPNSLFSLFGLVTVPAKYWPYVLLVLDGAMGGQLALAQSLTGLLAGHAWFLLAWRDEEARRSFTARAPIWLTRFIPNRPAPVAPGTTGPQPPGFGAPRRENARPTGYNWGTGHRLGDS